MSQPSIRRKLWSLRERLRVIAMFESHAHWRRQDIASGTVLYESFAGNGMLCNPEAIFRHLLGAPDLRHLRHVWALNDLEKHAQIIEEFSGDARVKFVRRGSRSYYRALATAQYLVNNATFPGQFSKRPEQTYLNTWHGTPLKLMGYDVENGGPHTHNIVRNFLNADYLLSGSAWMTRQMYETAYRLKGIYPGRIIQEGFPRTDLQNLSAQQSAEVRAELLHRGVSLEESQGIILYAPTWKGDSFQRPDNDIDQLRAHVRQLSERIDTSRWRVLLRVHQQVYRYAIDEPDLQDVLVPNDMPTNVVLGVTDVLVTDYSSIFFDFLATRRPVLFFVPDMNSYNSYRGLYMRPDELPGPVVDNVDELAERVAGLGPSGQPPADFVDRYEQCVAQYCPSDDGGVTERIVDVVFHGNQRDHSVLDGLPDQRRSILINLGGLRTNGITSAALNLLDNIDHDRYDVSVLYKYRPRRADRRKNEAAINSRVRLLPYSGGMNGSKRHTLGRRRLLAEGVAAGGAGIDVQRRLFQEEWARLFGPVQFDYGVDFSGYGPYWTFLLLFGKIGRRSIWLHSDMAADRLRNVGGRQPMRRELQAIFSAYRYFDHVVSVSPALAKVNEEKLADQVGDVRFTSAVNTVNHQRVLQMSGVDLLAELDEEGDESLADPDGPVDPEEEERRRARAARRAERRAMLERLLSAEAGVTFVAVGRLSIEKNYQRLLRAFDAVHRERPDTRLVVIGGGPLRNELDQLVDDLGLADAVILTGQQANPYAIMRRADCFVITSDYEGQPMVTLEARVLGLPVVSTDFASVRSSLDDGVGVVVPRSVEGVAQGMREFLEGNVPNPPFDYVAYNRDAVGQFYRAIGAEADREADSDGASALREGSMAD